MIILSSDEMDKEYQEAVTNHSVIVSRNQFSNNVVWLRFFLYYIIEYTRDNEIYFCVWKKPDKNSEAVESRFQNSECLDWFDHWLNTMRNSRKHAWGKFKQQN